MLGKWTKRLVGIAVVIALIGVVVYALLPAPTPVDLADVDRGQLVVTVDEEGVARIRDVFRVSAPNAGSLERPPVHVGDRVYGGATQVAAIRPVEPAFLDVRSRREIEAAVDAARATVGVAEAQLRGAESNERVAQAAYDRAQRLAALDTISEQAFEMAAADLDAATALVAQAKATLALRQSELASAEARLIEPGQPVASAGRNSCCRAVLAPVDGVVLKVLAESETIVMPGTPLVEIGDPSDMEIVVHLLSTDAVAIAPGTLATVTDWGGDAVLPARVRQIDPAAYTKVSALGIAEQRVDATLDLIAPYETWQRLGHEFRVMVHIETWRSDAALLVPIGALFRQGADWHVFRVVDGRARLTRIAIGQRNNIAAEVLDGLAPGDSVVLHPSDRISDGASVAAREITTG